MNFEPLVLEAREQLELHAARFPSYSDFNFVSLWSWAVDEDVEWRLHDGVMVVRFRDYLTGDHFYSVLGGGKTQPVVAELWEMCRSRGAPTELRLVPQCVLEELDKALEIDAYPDRQDLDVETLKLAAEAGVRISIGTDAHSHEQLEWIDLGVAAAKLAGIPEDRILNRLSLDELLGWVDSLRSRSA